MKNRFHHLTRSFAGQVLNTSSILSANRKISRCCDVVTAAAPALLCVCVLPVLLLCLAVSAKPAQQEKTLVQKLPAPALKGNISLEEAILARRSVRAFRPDTLTLAQISQLLWAAQGITDQQSRLRTAPSAGATYPLVTYVVTDKGLFLYDPEEHTLTLKRDADLRGELSSAALGQRWVRECPAVIVFSAIYSRTAARYGPRAERFIHMEAGHAAQNVHLQAVALGLGSCPVGAFDDDRVSRVLGLPKTERPLYIIPVGQPR